MISNIDYFHWRDRNYTHHWSPSSFWTSFILILQSLGHQGSSARPCPGGHVGSSCWHVVFFRFFSVPRGKRPPRLRLEAHTKGFGPRDTDCGGHVQGADVCQSWKASHVADKLQNWSRKKPTRFRKIPVSMASWPPHYNETAAYNVSTILVQCCKALFMSIVDTL